MSDKKSKPGRMLQGCDGGIWWFPNDGSQPIKLDQMNRIETELERIAEAMEDQNRILRELVGAINPDAAEHLY